MAGAVLAAVLMGVGSAVAAPGQCSVSGFGAFPCEVALDGGGLSFGLPDGSTLAFTLTETDGGAAYLIAADGRPGSAPRELGMFDAVAGEPGCWMRDEDYRFCVLVEETGS